MKNYVILKCPNCDAELEVDENLELFYCQHCGTKLMMPAERKYVRIDHNINRTNRYVDEAEIEREKQETYRSNKQQETIQYIAVSILGAIVFYILYKLHTL